MNRRHFLAATTALIPSRRLLRIAADAERLTARPHRPTGTVDAGNHALGLSGERDTTLIVPPLYAPSRPTPLILALHGATQSGAFMVRTLQEASAAHGQLLLVPQSRDVSWDMIRSDAGEDERLIDRALAWTFDHCNVDPARVTIAGFSDGATMALSLGLINGDLFRRIVAFSPGFIIGTERHGKPPVFISHGTRDQILPIDQTSRRIVPALRHDGYTVDYHEFDGPHFPVPPMVAAALAWLDAAG